MKFYEINNDELNYYPIEIYESEDGEWAKSADAEQAAKDAVEMARIVETVTSGVGRLVPEWKKAQAIIERYEGGEG